VPKGQNSVFAKRNKIHSGTSYQNQWQTNEKWASLIWVHCQDIIFPLLNTSMEQTMFLSVTPQTIILKEAEEWKHQVS